MIKAGVSIIFKIWAFYKAWFGRFFIVWPYAVFLRMQVVFLKRKSADFMYFEYLWRIKLAYLTWCIFSVHNDGPKRTNSSIWQSPIDHHSILLAICFIVSWHFGLRSCQTQVFHKFGWFFHRGLKKSLLWYIHTYKIFQF